MPVAIETSKRKFHKLLETLTSSSSSADTTQDASVLPAPAAKRARLTPSSRLRRTPARATIPSRTEPNYAPYSQEAFLTRLRTFADLRHWTAKPDPINDVVWAKRGWSLDTSRVNYVACKGGCEARLLVRLRPERTDEAGAKIADSEDFEVEIDDGLVGKYAQLVAEGHREGCLWRDDGCGDAVQRIRIARPVVWIPALRARYASLHSLGGLPDLQAVTLPETLDLDSVEKLVPGAVWADAPETRNKVALAFALTGWKGVKDAGHYSLATCEHCFRRVGLWLYAAPKADDDESMKLDLLANHREWCPWTNGAAQHMPGAYAGLAAWEILVRCIENNASFEATGKALDEHVNEAQVRVGDYSDKENGGGSDSRPGSSAKSDADVEREDKVRFERLKKLTSSIGLRNWKRRVDKPVAG